MEPCLKEQFLQCLPASIRMVLVTAPANHILEELAELAAEVSTPTVAAVTPNQQTSTLEQLKAEVAKLRGSLQSLTIQRKEAGEVLDYVLLVRHPINHATPPSAGTTGDLGKQPPSACTPPCLCHGPPATNAVAGLILSRCYTLLTGTMD